MNKKIRAASAIHQLREDLTPLFIQLSVDHRNLQKTLHDIQRLILQKPEKATIKEAVKEVVKEEKISPRNERRTPREEDLDQSA